MISEITHAFARFVVLFDRKFLNRLLIKLINYYRVLSSQSALKRHLPDRLVIYCDTRGDNLLSVLSEMYGSDKGRNRKGVTPFSWPAHTYTHFYERLFAHRRHEVKSVFECGIGTNNPELDSTMGMDGRPGASLRMWRDYFPNARIVGADIDKNILFNDDRILTYYVNQTDKESIAEMLSSIESPNFNLIIDDGLHTFDAGSTLFEGLIHCLSDDGLYVIEDVAPKDRLTYLGFFRDQALPFDFIDLHSPDSEMMDNFLIVVRKQL